MQLADVLVEPEPGVGGHGSGIGATFYSSEELARRFGAHPLGFMIYNVVGGLASLACLVLAGLLRRSWALAAGSVLQVLIIATGVVVPTMFFLGAVFAGLWALAIFLGRRVERLQAAAGPKPADG